jgi:hypothetical protein
VKFFKEKFKNLGRYASKTAVLVVLTVSVFSPFQTLLTIPVAHAEAGCPDGMIPAGGGNCKDKVPSYYENGVPKLYDASGKLIPQGTAAGTGAADALSCSPSNVSVCLANVVYAFTVGLGSGLAYVGGFMLDTTVSLSLNSAAYALSFLSSGWTAARDLANMAFILILVYIAFMIMFQAETAGTIRMLAWVIFIALIINFSFFFTRVVIDVSNILAVQFYNSIQAPNLQQTMNATSAQTGIIANTAAGIANAASPQGSLANTKDLTYSIMQALNLQQLFSNESFKSFANQSGFGAKFIVLTFLYLMVGACYFLLAAMFLAVSIKFIVRVVVLWFLIIASPLAFICKAVPRPEVSAWYDKWQHELVNHAFYPAFFLFIFFFISTIMGSFGGQNDILKNLAESLNAAASDPNLNGFIYIATAVANVGIRLGFVIAMLYIALKASEFMGVKGGELAHSVTGLVSRAGTGAVFGGAGAAGRYTMGLAGKRLAQNAGLRETYSKGGAAGVGAGLLLRTGAGLSKKSFDLRGAPGVRRGLGLIGIDTREASGKGGYAAAYDARVKSRLERAEYFKQDKSAVDRELEKIITGLPLKEQENIARADKAVEDAEKEVADFGSGDGRGDAFKRATRQRDDLVKEHKKLAEESAGKDFKNNYAKSLTTLGWHNLGGIASSGIPGVISKADREAAAKSRTDKKGGKFAQMIGMKLDDLPAGRRWSPKAGEHVPKEAGGFEIGEKAHYVDGGKQHEGAITDFSPDGKTAYFGDKAIPVAELHDEKTNAKDEHEQARTYDPNAITALLAANLATTQQPQPQAQRTPADQVFTVNNRGTATSANQRAESYINRPQELNGKTLVNNNGEEFVVTRVNVDPKKPGGGIVAIRREDGSSMPMTLDDFKKPESINTYSIKPAPATQAQPAQMQPNQNPVVPYTPPSVGSQPPPPSGGNPPPAPPLPQPNNSSPISSAPEPERRERIIEQLTRNKEELEKLGPKHADEVIRYERDIERHQQGHYAGEESAASGGPSTPPPMTPTPSTPGKDSVTPQPYTEKTSEITETHEQPDGSFSATPAVSGELMEQMRGLRTEVANLQSAVVAQPKPQQSFVKPPPKQIPWTPKAPPAPFSVEQKRQMRNIIEEATKAQTEKLEDKFAEIKNDMDRKEDIKTREEWLKKEGKRILDNRGPDDHISTNENPPPPPRQKPEDTK